MGKPLLIMVEIILIIKFGRQYESDLNKLKEKTLGEGNNKWI